MLHANLVRKMDGSDQAAWMDDFVRAAERLDQATAEALLDTANWRHRLAASWFVGFRGWQHVAERLAAGLASGSTEYETQGYCVGLALLGPASATEALCTYLDRSLQPTEPHAGQEWALAALVALDDRAGTTLAAPYLGDDGPWASWQAASRYSLVLPPVDRVLDLLSSRS